MSKRNEINASWDEFNRKREEEEFYHGMDAYEREHAWPYTPFEEYLNNIEKDNYLRGNELHLTESQFFSLIKESVKQILKEEFNLNDYTDSNDGWVKSLANNGEKLGLTPEEIETLIKKHMKEQDDYEIEQYNKTREQEQLRQQGEFAQKRLNNPYSYGENGSIYDDKLWNN